MATTIITFKAITSDRRIVRKNIPIEHEFEVIPAKKWHGIDLPPTSIEEQVMNQLDETDKTQIMIDYDFDLIIDYWPKKPRKKKADELKEFMEYCEPVFMMFPNLERPFRAIMAESKDTLFGKGKSNKTKFDEIMKIHELILKGAQGTLNLLNKIMSDNEKMANTKKLE